MKYDFIRKDLKFYIDNEIKEVEKEIPDLIQKGKTENEHFIYRRHNGSHGQRCDF